jgi:lipopolysaccharide export system protein LptC
VVFLDEQGNESFSAHGPLLARDPVSGEITLDRPEFRVPTAKGEWLANAQDGWIDARGDVMRLTRDVEVVGTPTSGEAPTRLSTQLLTVYPDQQRATSEAPVTVTHGGSILRGRGLDADLAARRIQLADVRGRHVPIAR